jgi:exodeoxyribonuclease VII large subunit
MAVLGRGYSLTRDERGAVITSALQLAAGDLITTVFADGEADSEVRGVTASRADG